MELTKDQQRAYELMSSGQNVFITGEAGTGKSFLLNKFIKDNIKDKKILITAPTGIAAIEVGGATLHRTFGIPVHDLYGVNRGPYKISEAVKTANILIIDEISMCRLDTFEYVLKAIELANKSRPPHKHYQIILVGDFLQLPPILGNDAEYYEHLYGHTFVFPFFSSKWSEFNFKTIELKEVVRQQGDYTLIENLSKARRGDRSCLNYFNRFVVPSSELDQDAIFISPTNRSAAQINFDKTQELPGKSKTYYAKTKGEVKPSDKLTEDELELKVGARVMTLINNEGGGYLNGSMGTCISLQEDKIIVKMDNGTIAEIKPYTWDIKAYQTSEVEDSEGDITKEFSLETIGHFTQLPIKIAFAITIHKSQGQTFEKAVVDPYAWDSGQLYVALSRVKSSNGLQLSKRIFDKYLIANSEVLDFYRQGSKTLVGGSPA